MPSRSREQNTLVSDCSFALRQLAVLSDTRAENGEVLGEFIVALASLTQYEPTTKVNYSDFAAASNVKTAKKSKWQFFRYLRFHLGVATRALSSARREETLTIYAIDPNRLDIQPSQSLESALSVHTASDLSVLSAWFHEDNDPKTILAFDPKTAPDYRSISDVISEPAMSPIAIMFLTFLRPTCLLWLPRIYWEGQKILGPSYNTFRKRFVSLLLISVFLLGVTVLARGSGRNLRMLCMTSNSVFLEALRALILAKPTGYVVEIQHGIASPQFDPYFLSYKPALAESGHGKLDIIPLLAPPFCATPTIGKGFALLATPSNTGILRALNRLRKPATSNDQKSSRLDDINFLADAVTGVASPYCRNGVPVVTIYGGTDLGNDFYAGDAFKSEMAIIGKIRQGFSARNMSPLYLYSPHPTNRPISRISFADGGTIAIFKQSQLSYFFADYAFALYSSSIFEAASLGAYSYSPMAPKTGIFHSFMLETINTPKKLTRQGLDASIDEFVAIDPLEASNHAGKIEGRISKFLHGNV